MKKKAVIFDCDNTLWRGVVGEDVIEHNTEIQKTAIMLAEKGVIVGLCSKNNEDDVLATLKTGLLTLDYISVYRINWKDKASNLKEIIEELNIGADAVVFVDDSKFEISLIQDLLPEVTGIYPHELLLTIAKYFDLSGSILKTKQYKENYNRAKAKEQFSDIEDYLRSLDMCLSIKVNDTLSTARIAELTQKTNQFNLTTKRYKESEICDLMSDGLVYSLSVRDKFGDNGLTGVCIIKGNVIDTFLLSCRILGRNIEYAFLDWVIRDVMHSGLYWLMGSYIATPKNKQTKCFYSDMGFTCIHVTGDDLTFVLPFISYESKAIDYIRYEGENNKSNV